MALGAAVTHETHFSDGKAVEQNFNTYRMPRINDTPEIEVHIMENDEKAGGVGEPGLPPFTPALTNAIFDAAATGALLVRRAQVMLVPKVRQLVEVEFSTTATSRGNWTR